MMQIGLTGSIASGKSTVAGYMRDAKVPVFDSDAAVHALYAIPEFASQVEELFPGTTGPQGVIRSKLAELVLPDQSRLQSLEALVHPAVRALQRKFAEQNSAQKLIVIDVPLLLEKNRAAEFDSVILVCAPHDIRKNRAMQRPNMTEQKWQQLEKHQLPEIIKRKHADIIIENDGSLENLRLQTLAALATLQKSGSKP